MYIKKNFVIPTLFRVTMEQDRNGRFQYSVWGPGGFYAAGTNYDTREEVEKQADDAIRKIRERAEKEIEENI